MKSNLEKRREELLSKMLALKGEDASARTRFLLFLVETEVDPERVWAAGDDVITYMQFLEEHDICSRKEYERFADGLKKLERTSMASATTTDKLAQQVGHEAISRLPKIKTKKNVERFLGEAIDHRNQFGCRPNRQKLDALLQAIQPRAATAPKPPEKDVKKLRAKLEFAEAEVARLQQQQQQLEAENKRLIREIALLREQLGGRRPRKAAAAA